MYEDHLMEKSTRLNEQQLEMLRLFHNPMSEQDFNEIKKLVVKILARKIDEEMERLENEKGWTAETYEQWGQEQMRAPHER